MKESRGVDLAILQGELRRVGAQIRIADRHSRHAEALRNKREGGLVGLSATFPLVFGARSRVGLHVEVLWRSGHLNV